MAVVVVGEAFRTQADSTSSPIDPAHALLKRFAGWEKRVANLQTFFNQIQCFQKDIARHYSALSDIAGENFGDETLSSDGVMTIWKGLRDKTRKLGVFYAGLSNTYVQKILGDLEKYALEIKVFKGDIERLRSKEVDTVSKKQKDFQRSVRDLQFSITRLRANSGKDDPFVRNRECMRLLKKFIDKDNDRKRQVANVHGQCADFEFKLIPKLKAIIKSYVAITQKESSTVGEHFSELNHMADRVPPGLDWEFFVTTEPSIRAGTGLQDPARFDYTNSDHHLTTPVISGEIYCWNRFRQRWDPATFCVTRGGYLLRFEQPLSELEHNVKPRQSYCLQRTVLGELIPIRGDLAVASFTLTYDRYTYDNFNYGVKKVLKAPVRAAKLALSKLTAVKFGIPRGAVATAWYEALATFAQKERNGKSRKNRYRFATVSVCSAAPSVHQDYESEEEEDWNDGDEEDFDGESIIETSSAQASTSKAVATEDYDKDWEELDKKTRNTHSKGDIAGVQPGHITHNPW